MEKTAKLHAGQKMEPLTFKRLDGAAYQFGGAGAWQALIVYRGQHCPICTGYLGKIKQRLSSFEKLGVQVAALSADNEAQARMTFDKVHPNFPLLYGLDEAGMRALGLYISQPRSASETDHLFPEPGLFVVNPDGALQIIDISNAPFARPDLDVLLGGLEFVIKNAYPVRGTHQ